jgi:hypothetical protein
LRSLRLYSTELCGCGVWLAQVGETLKTLKLMCFDVGESQEEADAVVARGRRMLPLLKKYRDKNPAFRDRSYPDVMLKGLSNKADTFEGVVKAIQRGWPSITDAPD